MIDAGSLIDECSMVAVGVPDHWGNLLGKRRPVGHWPDLVASGLPMPDFHLVTGFDNRPHADFAVSGAATGFRNGLLMPVPEAAFVSPSEPRTLLVIADALDMDGRPAELAPRSILKRQIARLAELGITCRAASELEFYVFHGTYPEIAARQHDLDRPLYHRNGDNDLLVSGFFDGLHAAIADALARSGIVLNQIQGEAGTGQCEINIEPASLLIAADDHIAFKHIVKTAAQTLGLSATFLAQPLAGQAGSGGHFHLSFKDAAGRNAMADEAGLTGFGQAFIAGILQHTGAFMPMHAPFLNSYRRLRPHGFAPTTADWAREARTPMLRVIGEGVRTRIEFRLAGADVNPYLGYAAVLAAGLAGVAEASELPPEHCGTVLPADATEAIIGFSASTVAREALGEAAHAHILGHAMRERDAGRPIVSAWEVGRGFERA